jgi:urease accessory protein
VTTRIELVGERGRPRCLLRGGLLVPRRLPDRDGVVRVALVASTALLLAGDEVRVEVVVGPGLALDVVETAGTVAYAMRGGAARWQVAVHVAGGARLTWAGLPFVVADGSVVDRSTVVDLGDGAVAVLRESLVLGRSGEPGGRLVSSTRVVLGGRPLLVESLVLDPDTRRDPVVLAGARCLDSVSVLGARLPDGPDVLQLDGTASIARRLTDDLHLSTLEETFATAARLAHPVGVPPEG